MASNLGSGTETSFVLTFFEEFYARVALYKKKILQHRWDYAEKGSSPSAEGGGDEVIVFAKKIWVELKEILDRQAFDAPRFGGEFAAQYYREAQYIMVSLADEIFLSLQWKGRSYWEEHLLESSFFGTHASGEIFFRRLDDFLSTQDPMRKDIAHLYLLALGLGFWGQYRGKNDQGRLAAYKHQLYVFVYHQEPHLFKEEGEKLVPQAYACTLKQGTPRSLHDYKPWVWAYGVALGTLLLISMIVWHHSTHSIQASVAKILSVKERLESRDS